MPFVGVAHFFVLFGIHIDSDKGIETQIWNATGGDSRALNQLYDINAITLLGSSGEPLAKIIL